MRIRIVMSGIFAGAICVVALWLPWYVAWPADFTAEWEYFDIAQNLPGWLESGIMVFCGIALFAFGWTAARWNWEKNWRDSLLAGGEMGLIAGCLIYDFIGAFHYGSLGQKDVLAYFYVTLTEAQGLNIMANAVVMSAGYMIQGFFLTTGASTVIGALGGLASAFDLEDVWGSPSRIPDQWLHRISVYTLTLNGLLFYALTLAFYGSFQDSAHGLIDEVGLENIDQVAYLFFIKLYLVALMAALFPLGITWGWIISGWRRARLWRIMQAIWVAATAYVAGKEFVSFFKYSAASFYADGVRFSFSYYDVASNIDLILSLCALGAGIALGLLSSQPTIPDSKYSFTDWLGSILAQGILGGTQILICFPAYAIVLVIITIQNVPHLINTGPSDMTIAEQIAFLSEMLNGFAGAGILFCVLGGVFVSGIITLARKFLKIAPQNIPPDAPIFVE